MRWWLKTRNIPMVLAGTFTTTLLSLWVGGEQIMLPSLFSGSMQAVLTIFLPMPTVAVIALALDSRIPGIEAVAVRPVLRYDVAVVLAVLATFLVVAAATHSGILACVARNTAFLTGLTLTFRPFAKQAAVTIPVAWIGIVVFLGKRPWPDPDPWTLLPEPATAFHALLGAFVMILLGIIVHLHHISRNE
ncbi:hypothetical protein ACLQ18_08600 [Streptomyces sp. DT193]|uniref:hypothetical protein n=1 Tax=Streptomyces sp. DT193 TaxID=3393418 RepID=UPI003CF9A23C